MFGVDLVCNLSVGVGDWVMLFVIMVDGVLNVLDF